MIRKIFVMGGGGFSMEPENPLLDQYILSLSSKKNPKVCFVPTASADSEDYVAKFFAAFKKLPSTPAHLSLFKPPVRNLREYILEQDIIYVGGGNTKNLIALWKEWSLDRYIQEAYARGTVLCGISAGMICWFEQGLTDSFGPGTLEPLSCLGILEGSACPHFDGEANRRPRFVELLKEGKLRSGIALDDSVGALYENEELVECVTSVAGKRGFLFESKTGDELKLPVRILS